MSKKALGVVIKLVSMANTGYFYTTMKNARLPKKLLLRKYDPIVRQHVLFKRPFSDATIKEEKISKRKR